MGEGMVIKAISGFFTVSDGDVIRQCRARGIFRKRGQTVLVGDRVLYEPIGRAEGIVTDVLPRHTELVRPPIANVDQALVVASITAPAFLPSLVDRILVAATAAGLHPVIALTKCDLVTSEEVDQIRSPYEQAGYEVLALAARDGQGLDELVACLEHRVTVFAGPSGAGKTTLANALSPELGLKMGELSEKGGRGKHTTRHVELFPLQPGTFIADAPGFSQLEIDLPSAELRRYFPEFVVPSRACAYRGCQHIDEADCGVKQAVADQRVSAARYQSYCALCHEIRDREERKY